MASSPVIPDDAHLPEAAQPRRSDRAATLNLAVLFSTVAAVVLILLSYRSAVDDDLWLHLRIGDELRNGRRFDGVDPLTALADRRYMPTQWLAEVIASIAYGVTGLTGIHVMRLIAVALLAFAIYGCARTLAPPVNSAALALPTLVATSAAWAERPQLVGLVMQAFILWVWLRAWRRGAVPWLVVLITWFWACLHGSWAVGIATSFVMTLGVALETRQPRAWKLHTIVLALSALAVGLTPLGPALLLEPLNVSSAARQSVHEWQSPAVTNPLLLVVLAMAFVAALALIRRRAWSWVAVGLLTLGGGLAVYSVRTIAFGALLVGAALVAALFVGKPSPRPRRDSENWLWLLTTTVIVLGGLVWGSPRAEITDPSLRTQIARIPFGTIVAVQPEVSGWVLFHQPQLRPLRDLRAEAYSASATEMFGQIWAAGAGWEHRLETLGVQAVLVRSGEPLARALATTTWRRVAVGNDFELWVDAGCRRAPSA